jgi:hypothetical protein
MVAIRWFWLETRVVPIRVRTMTARCKMSSHLIDDPHKYDCDLRAVRLEYGEAGVRVITEAEIPCNRTIRRVIAGALVAVYRAYGLGANFSFEGGISGCIVDPNEEGVQPVDMQWVCEDNEIWLMSDSPLDPFPGDTMIAESLYNVLENAMFRLARDGNGYPLILSSDDPTLVTYILLEGFRRQFGGIAHTLMVEFFNSPEGSNIALAGLT